MLRLVLVLSILLAQDKVDLAWQLTEGSRMTTSWTCDLKMGGEDGQQHEAHMEFAGTLTVGKIADGNAECDLLLNKVVITGSLQDNKMDLHVENGEVKRPEGDEAMRKRILDQMAVPVKLSLGPRGLYAMKGSHPFGAMFIGKSDFFGPELSAKPVAVGEVWASTLRGPAANAETIPVKYKLAAVENGRAKITLDETVEMTPEGITIDVSFKTESSFDIAGGYCAHSKVVATSRTSDKRFPALNNDATLEFKFTPLKKE